ncbi:MAG TPA: TetR/AcrR family transcriptional regulator [Solirubrobacterales bacterium]|nr:TetR/AcrR family transcriptional regulator [Solirubrobacterales bacterium]
MPQEQVQEEHDPFGSGKLPSGRHGLPRDVVVRSQRERMVEAMIGVVAEKGYTEATVADIISTAGVSRATFYEQFADKEDCFIAAYGTVMERMLTFVADGFAQGSSDDWVVQIRGGIGALLTYLAENPVAARVGIVEGFGAGPRARDRYQQAVSSFFPFLDSARNMVDEPDRIPTQVARVIVGGVSALMFNEASNGRAADLPKMLPDMMYLAVTPYFGHDRGIEAMEETRVSA